jgi:hypothetical protein
MKSSAVGLNSISQKMMYYNLLINTTANDLPFSSEISSQIKKALSKSSSRLSLAEQKVSKMSSTLTTIADTYKSTELKRLNKFGQAVDYFKRFTIVLKENNISVPVNTKSYTWNDEKKALLNFLNSSGVIGAMLGGCFGILTGANSTKKVFNLAKSVDKVVEGVADISSRSDVSFNWKSLSGWYSKINSDTPKSFGENFTKTFTDLNMGNAKSVSDKVKIGAKWAGYAITIASTVYDNFTDETENNSFGRKVAESVGESSVKILESALIGAATTAAFASMGVAAPVVVVGGVVVVASYLIDKASKALTGKDFAEATSDFILDKGGEIINKAGKAINNASKTISNMIGNVKKISSRTISGWWNGAFGAA